MKASAQKIISIIPFASLLLLVLAGCTTPPASPPASASSQFTAPTNAFQAGMAEIDITPPVGFRLAGYFNERPSTGIHDPLKAKALVLQQGQEQMIWVFCDLVGMSLNVSSHARLRASLLTGVPVSHIVIAATHSHTGPLFDNVLRDYFHATITAKYGKDPLEVIDYPRFLIDQIVKVIRDAEAKVEPVEIDTGVATQVGLPFNRRYHMKNGTVAFNPGLRNPNIVGPAGPVDSTVGMLLVKSLKLNQSVGGLTVFAMHADTAGGTLYSADYPYYIEQALRNYFSQGYISAFAAGTCGDLNHVDVSKKQLANGFNLSEQLGTSIGDTVLHHLHELKPIESPMLAVKSETLTLPLQTVTPEELAEAKTNMTHINEPNFNFMAKVKAVKALDLAAHGPTVPLEIQVFRLDHDHAIVCLPCELFVELGLAIKKDSPFKDTFVMTVCNDRPSYVPTLKAFREGSYEVTNARVAPGDGEEMVKCAIKLLNELKPNP